MPPHLTIISVVQQIDGAPAAHRCAAGDPSLPSRIVRDPEYNASIDAGRRSGTVITAERGRNQEEEQDEDD
jgi:hypothetical protein